MATAGILVGILSFGLKSSIAADGAGIEEVSNISLMQRQMMIFISSLVLFLAGVITISTGAILKFLASR